MSLVGKQMLKRCIFAQKYLSRSQNYAYILAFIFAFFSIVLILRLPVIGSVVQHRLSKRPGQAMLVLLHTGYYVLGQAVLLKISWGLMVCLISAGSQWQCPGATRHDVSFDEQANQPYSTSFRASLVSVILFILIFIRSGEVGWGGRGQGA